MATQLVPLRMAEPPPTTHYLSDNQRTVGWVTESALGFCGFADANEAANAAWVVYRTVSRQLAQRRGDRPLRIGVEPLSIVPHGDREQIVASGRYIAALLRPGSSSRANDNSFGFELLVEPRVDQSTMCALSRLAYRTLRKSGIRWGMWKRPSSAVARVGPALHEVKSPPIVAPTPSATEFVSKVIFALMGLVMAAALVLSAPRYFATILAVIVLTAAFVLRFAAMWKRWRPVRSRPRREDPTVSLGEAQMD
jgi:hypothetical protein